MAQLDDICQARIGTTLKGKWTLEKLLGTGGMAAVYVGVHKIGRRDAIKILHPEVAASADLKARFQREAETTNRFCHPGAVEIRDFDVSEDGCPFLVMELLDGESLGERARRLGGIAEAEILAHVEALCDVLAAAHREGIVHRDVKLDNLFVTTDQKLKVLDFGIARVRSGPVLTMSGARLGTTAYMPPEQIRGGEIDGRADLFAVGATMFRLLAKRRIHEAATESELVIKMASEPAPKLRSVAPEVSEGIALIADRALEFQAENRYPNALTMQEDVRAVRSGSPPPFATARLGASSSNAGAFTAFEPTGVAGLRPASFATDATRAEGNLPGPRPAPPAPSLGSRRPPPRPTVHGAPRPVVASSGGPVSGPADVTQAAPPAIAPSDTTMAIGIPVAPAVPRSSPPPAQKTAQMAAPNRDARSGAAIPSDRPGPTALGAAPVAKLPSVPPSMAHPGAPYPSQGYPSGAHEGSSPVNSPGAFGPPSAPQGAQYQQGNYGNMVSPATPMSMAVPSHPHATPLPGSVGETGHKSVPPPSVGSPYSAAYGAGGPPSSYGATTGPNPSFDPGVHARPWSDPAQPPPSRGTGSRGPLIVAVVGILAALGLGAGGLYYFSGATSSATSKRAAAQASDDDDSATPAKDNKSSAPSASAHASAPPDGSTPHVDPKATSTPASPPAVPVQPPMPSHPVPAKPAPPTPTVPTPSIPAIVPTGVPIAPPGVPPHGDDKSRDKGGKKGKK